MRTSPFSTIYRRSFFALRRGMSSFLFLVCSYLGSFSLIWMSIWAISPCFLAINAFIRSLACLSFIFTTSTLSICVWIVLFFDCSLTSGSCSLFRQIPIDIYYLSNQHSPLYISIQIFMPRDKFQATPLTFKSSLVRRKLNHPPAFPKTPKGIIVTHPQLKETCRTQFQPNPKSNKFSFRNNSLNNVQLSPSSSVKKFEVSSYLGTEASEEVFQKRVKIEALRRSLSEKKNQIHHRYSQLHDRSEQLKRSLIAKEREVAGIIRSIKILM